MLRILTEEAETGIRRVGSTNIERLARDAVICRELLQAHWALNGLVEGKQQMQRRLQCGSPRREADLIPIVHAYELKTALNTLRGCPVSIICDGTDRHGRQKVYCLILRGFNKEDFTISNKLLAYQFWEDGSVRQNLVAEWITGKLSEWIFGKLADPAEQMKPVFFISDSGSNLVSCSEQLQRKGIPLMFLPCLCHLLSNTGKRLSLPSQLQQLISKLQDLMQEPSARDTWKRIDKQQGVGSLWLTNHIRWYETYRLMVRVFQGRDQLHDLVAQLQKSKKCKVKAMALKKALKDQDTWLRPLAAVIDFFKPFEQICTVLEGDGFLAPFVSHLLETLQTHCETFSLEQAPNCREVGCANEDLKFLQQAQDYFQEHLTKTVRHLQPIAVFKAAQVLHPEYRSRCSSDDFLTGVDHFGPLVDVEEVVEQEFPRYMEEQLQLDLTGTVQEQANQLWGFWQGQRKKFPHLANLAGLFGLASPSGAACDRLFSVEKALFGDAQIPHLQDFVESTLMARRNSTEPCCQGT